MARLKASPNARAVRAAISASARLSLIALILGGCAQSLAIKDELVQKVVEAGILYTLNISAGLGGTITPNGADSVHPNTPVSISATPSAGGYLFNNWTATPSSAATFGNANSASTTVTITSDNVTIKANFTPPATRSWGAVTSDSSGQHLAAVNYGEYVYTSSNYGVTWTQQSASPSTYWTSIASDSTGRYLAAIALSDTIYTSTNYGVSWTKRTTGLPASANWQSIASDNTGAYLAAVVSGGSIYTSTNYGASWTAQTNGAPSSGSWWSITSDGTGQYLAAVTGTSSGNVYFSTDYGAHWYVQTVTNGSNGPPTPSWTSITINRTVTSGNIYYAAAIGTGSGGDIWTRWNNSMAPLWTDVYPYPSSGKLWTSITSDNTGQYLAATVSSGTIYSTYSGSWTATSAPSAGWTSIACDGSGTYLVACAWGGHIYTCNQTLGTWTLSL
jgi:Divergent InlB B-repeat domain